MWNRLKSQPIFVGIVLIAFWHLAEGFSPSGFGSVVKTIVSPLLASLAIAFVMNIPMNVIEDAVTHWVVKHPKTRFSQMFIRIFSIAFSFLSASATLCALVRFAAPQLVNAAGQLAAHWPDISAFVERIVEKLITEFPMLSSLFGDRDLLDEAARWINRVVGAESMNISGAVSAMEKAFAAIGRSLIALILSFYLLFNKERFVLQTKRMLFAALSEVNAQYVLRIARLTELRFSGFVQGQAAGAIVLGILFFAVLTIFRYPYALLISVVIAVTAIVPIFGSITGILFGIAMTAVVSPDKIVMFAVLFVGLQQIEDNFIYPRIVGKRVGLNGFWVLFSVTAGASLAGVVGILLAVPVTSIIYAIAVDYVEYYLNEREIPPEKYL